MDESIDGRGGFMRKEPNGPSLTFLSHETLVFSPRQSRRSSLRASHSAAWKHM